MAESRYLDFFMNTMGERHLFLQGGRRSGKTWTSIAWLRSLCGQFSGMEVTVLCYQYPQLQATMEDFKRCTGMQIYGSTQDGYCSMTEGGTKWKFRACDDRTKAQGTQCDFLLVNESVNFPADKNIIETYSMGVRRQIIYNFNPTKTWPYMTGRANDRNVLCTTWKDNACHLTAEQIAEFEIIRQRAMRQNATRLDQYLYKVYYLGEFGELAGAVFGSIRRCSVAEYLSIPAKETFGMDFGFAVDGDPTTLMGVKIHDNTLYVHQYIYEQGLTSDRELAHRIVECGLNSRTMILADYGGMGRGRMQTLITADNGKWTEPEISHGFAMYDAPKTKILDGLSQMQTFDGIVVTDTSVQALTEFEGYELDASGKPVGADHAIDAVRYATTYAKNYM